MNIFDKIALGSAALFFLFSFFSRFRTVDVGPFGTFGISAWHSYAVLGLLIALVAAVLVALKALQPSVLPVGAPWPLITAAAAALGWFLVLLRGLTYDGGSVGWSGWLVFLTGLIFVAATVIPLTSAAGSVEQQLNDRLGHH
ncbi:MAG: hypothetical protein ACTHOG_07460 [Marmoricola sp.]